MRKVALNKLITTSTTDEEDERNPAVEARGRLGQFARAKQRRRAKNKLRREASRKNRG